MLEEVLHVLFGTYRLVYVFNAHSVGAVIAVESKRADCAVINNQTVFLSHKIVLAKTPTRSTHGTDKHILQCGHSLLHSNREIGSEFCLLTTLQFPTVIVAPNLFMPAIDHFDQMCTMTPTMRQEK